MSAESESEVGLVRSVSENVGNHPVAQMSLIGYLVAAPMVIILLPLLPFLVVYWLVSRLFDEQ
jgi:hypothetical protein